MRKKRILFCSEATFLNTGYATYTREILNYLHETGKYEIAEMASYGQPSDPKSASIPWKYYGVEPNHEFHPLASQEEINMYNANPVHQFGELAFEPVCVDFMPDIVCDIRDFWMMDFQERSPFRPFYKWCIMPTVDADPQARQWIATYAGADAVLTYSDWAGTVLKRQSKGKINYLGSSPPSAHPAYKPVEDKRAHKEKFGLDPDCKIIGTVMRNQRRKLYYDLFVTFRKFLDERKAKGDKTKYFLYCHTSYPDLGWDMPELLQKCGITSHVLFTYICPETEKPFVSRFKGDKIHSPFKGKDPVLDEEGNPKTDEEGNVIHKGVWGATLSNVKKGASYEQLSDIMNLFDLYTQYANCEGFGLPQVEAAACGVPVCGTDYSAMESVLRKLDGMPITPISHYKELETGCMRAVPDNDLACSIFHEFFNKSDEERRKIGENTRKEFLKHYQWDQSGKKWEEYFDSVEVMPFEQTWGSQPRIHQPAPPIPQQEHEQIHRNDLAKWLIVNVMGQPQKLGTFFESRLTRDLMYGQTGLCTAGLYYNESSAAFEGGQNKQHMFNFDIAYNQLSQICQKQNHWEQKRWERVNELARQQQNNQETA